MKTYYPVTSLLLLLSAGCAESFEHTDNEAVYSAPVHKEVQPDVQVISDAFIVASNSLQLVPMPALIVTDILCQPCNDANGSKLVSTLNTEAELTASDLVVDGGSAPSADN